VELALRARGTEEDDLLLAVVIGVIDVRRERLPSLQRDLRPLL